MRTAWTCCLLAVAFALAGCGRQDLDLLVSCTAFETQADCDANAAFGCSFQPNEEGCLSTDPSCKAGVCRSDDAFVRTAGRSFFLNGEPFRFVGVSSWALLSGLPCTGIAPEEREVWTQQAYDGLVASGTKVARFYAFQSAAGPTGTDFTLLDASVRDARRAGIRLQLMLENGTNDQSDGNCSNKQIRDSAWYAEGYRNPEPQYALSYRAYAQAVAEHYRDEPTVLGYVLVHSLGNADNASIKSFVLDMGKLLEDVAPNQLVSLDLNWDGVDGGAGYRALQELQFVDLVDIGDFLEPDSQPPLDPNLVATLNQLNKPAIVGEGGFKLDGSDETALNKRAAKARSRMAQWKEWGLSGALFWGYQPGWETVSEEFDARPMDPLLQPGGVVASEPW